MIGSLGLHIELHMFPDIARMWKSFPDLGGVLKSSWKSPFLYPKIYALMKIYQGWSFKRTHLAASNKCPKTQQHNTAQKKKSSKCCVFSIFRFTRKILGRISTEPFSPPESCVGSDGHGAWRIRHDLGRRIAAATGEFLASVEQWKKGPWLVGLYRGLY